MSSNLDFPTLDTILGPGDKSVFEPTVPNLFKKSAFFINTVGMREAPERLVLELFREISFEYIRPLNESKARDLGPHEGQTLEELALLHIARGRGKRKRDKLNNATYFGPLYPELARDAWQRKQAERVVAYQLIDRPLAQYVLDNRVNARAFAQDVVSAIAGKARAFDGRPDVLKETLGRIEIDRAMSGLLDEQQAIGKLVDRFEAARGSVLDCGPPDKLAGRLAEDFQNLCKLEGKIPRLLWIDLLKCYLRMALPTWLLAHMRLTVSLRDWTLAALGGETIADEGILAEIQERWKGLFHPTQTGSNEIALHIERYVKARVELSLLTYWVRSILGNQAIEATLSVRAAGKDFLSVSGWLSRCRQAGAKIGLDCDGPAVRAKIVPLAQGFGAWLNPATKGQGKNIEEFLRILLRLPDSDEDDGYLLTGTKKGGFQRVVVFPGPAMLKTLLYLVAAEKKNNPTKTRGKIVLSDLEHHFAEYGVDFAASVGARPQLISELSRLGFLKGSPDAGDSAELIVPDMA